MQDASKLHLGKTSRNFETRIDEHLNFNKNKNSAIGKHIGECFACQGADMKESFSVMKSGISDTEISIIEALLIKQHLPELNKQMFEAGSSFILRIF